MSGITTHILDTTLGRPAANVRVELEKASDGWEMCGSSVTDSDGRATSLLAAGALQEGTYRLRFFVASYFEAMARESFYPHVDIVFQVRATDEHYHVPLLLNPFGYSTYRGS